MQFNIHNRLRFFSLVAVVISFIFASCNKDLPVAVPITTPPPSGSSMWTIIKADPNYSILTAAITRASTFNSPTGTLSALLSDSTKVFTFFAADDAAFQLSGIPSAGVINFFRPGQLDTLLKYDLIGGIAYSSSLITSSFPNLYLQSSFILAPPSQSLPPGLRMPIFPSKRGPVLFVNNIPVTQADIQASNGVIQKVAAVVAPPSQFLWDRINTDADLTYLKAAIIRADSGTAPASTLEAALQNPAANLTVFAPKNSAFQQILTGQITLALIPIVTQQLIPIIEQQLIAGGATPAQAAAQAPTIAAQQAPAIAQGQATLLASSPTVFQNPALFPVLTPTVVKGIIVYHILGERAFSVNLPPAAAWYPTLLNTAIPNHPGVSIQATFGPTGVTAATIQGVGNSSASNILINPTPAPGGTSDQHYINGTLHKIDQVLLPQ